MLNSNNTIVNDRSLKINNIFYVEFNFLLWEDIHRREFKTSSTIYKKMINAIKNIMTIACMTSVNNEKYKLWTNFTQKLQLNALIKDTWKMWVNRLGTIEKRKNKNVNRISLSFKARKIMNFKCHIIKLCWRLIKYIIK